MPTLKRLSDGMGDSGARSQAIKWNDDGTVKSIVGDRPMVGCSMLVGSITARSYSYQDYWLTTVITEIVEDTGDRVLFKTKSGNTYEFTI